MSKKDYVEFANLINKSWYNAKSEDAMEAVRDMQDNMIEIFKRDNSAFDEQRFRTACGI